MRPPRPASPRVRRRVLGVLAPTLLALLPLACSRLTTASAQDEHGHDHAEDASIAVTVWSEHHEVFPEYDVPVSGETSAFHTHVSVLATGAPRRAGPVTYRFTRGDDQTFEVVDRAPARDGIYTTEVSWPRGGVWAWTLVVPPEPGAEGAPATTDEIDMGDVLVFGDRHAADHADLPEGPDGIAFLKEQQWVLGTRTGVVAPRALEVRLGVPGRIRSTPDRTADVTPPVAGRLSAPDDGTWPTLGTRVAAGDVLAWVQPPLNEALAGAVEARAELARLQVAVERAQRQRDRTAGLHARQARSTRELEDTEFAVREAMAARDGARDAVAAYEAAGIISEDGGPPRFAMRAPIAGVVDTVHGVAGMSVHPEDTVFRVVDISVVSVEAEVLAEDVAVVDAPFSVTGSAHGESVVDMPPPLRLALAGAREEPVLVPEGAARLVHLGLHADERSGRVPVVFELDNPGRRWRPGTAVDVALVRGASAPVPAVPRSALVEEEGAQVVFVQLGGETFERRVVRTGRADDRWVEVLSGVDVGEHVVVEGAYAVRLASVSTADVGHGHAH